MLAGVALVAWFGPFSGAYAQAGASVPENALRYRAELIRNARATWGLNAPVATFAAQIHQESRWRADAVSPVGAQGMAQFMPATARWIAEIYPSLASCAAAASEPDCAANKRPLNPGWALRALVIYDRYLWERIEAASPCERMAMTLSAYNGGLGWVNRDRRLAAASGANRLVWFDHIERFNAGRSAAAFRENRGYPQVILRTFEPRYVKAGFGQGVCA